MKLFDRFWRQFRTRRTKHRNQVVACFPDGSWPRDLVLIVYDYVYRFMILDEEYAVALNDCPNGSTCPCSCPRIRKFQQELAELEDREVAQWHKLDCGYRMPVIGCHYWHPVRCSRRICKFSSQCICDDPLDDGRILEILSPRQHTRRLQRKRKRG
jgi:hypothetical protein